MHTPLIQIYIVRTRCVIHSFIAVSGNFHIRFIHILFFDYVKDYYEYLMLLFYNKKETVYECELCSRYFIPKTKKKTLYCDRVFKDGKICKQIGPLMKHKKLEENDLVLQTFFQLSHQSLTEAFYQYFGGAI